MRPTAIAVLVFGLLLSALSAGARAATAPPVTPLAPAARPPAIDLRALALVDGPELYRALGRFDLADRYEHRRGLKTGLRVTGVVALAVGVVWGLTDLFVEAFFRTVSCPPLTDPHDPSCRSGPSGSAVPWLVALGGLGLVTAPAFFSTDPLSASEKRALLDRIAPSLSVAPAPDGSGAAVRVGGRF